MRSGKRLKALDELEGIERAHRGPEIAQQGYPCLEDIGDRPEGLGRFRPDGAVVAGVRLGQQRKARAMLFPFEVAAVDDQAADRRPVAPNIFGRRVDDDGSPMAEGLAKHRCGGVVHDERNSKLAPDGSHFRDGEDGQFRVGQGLGKIGASRVVARPAEGVRIRGVDEANFDSHGPHGVGEEIPGAAVEIGRADNVVAGLGDVLDGDGCCRLAGADGKRGRSALKHREALLEDIRGRIGDAGIEVSQFLEREQVCGVLGSAELIGRRLIDRDRDRSRRGIRTVGAPMECEGLGLRRFDHH